MNSNAAKPNRAPSRCRTIFGRRWCGGFTLVEVVMSTFVMVFGISSSLIVIQSGFKQIDLARGTTVAAQILQSEMERLRMMSWTMISSLPASETFDGTTYFSANPEIAGKYTVTRLVAENAAEPAEVKDLSVAVQWQSFDGRWHQRSFTAIYARNGLYDYFYTVAHP